MVYAQVPPVSNGATMTIAIACPSCGTKMKAPDGVAGVKVKCLKCATPFIAQPTKRAAPPVEKNALTGVQTEPFATPLPPERENPNKTPKARHPVRQGFGWTVGCVLGLTCTGGLGLLLCCGALTRPGATSRVQEAAEMFRRSGVQIPLDGEELRIFESVVRPDRRAGDGNAAAEIERLQKEIARAEGMLANKRFVQNAPASVVEAEREKLERYRRELDALAN